MQLGVDKDLESDDTGLSHLILARWATLNSLSDLSVRPVLSS